MLIFAALKENKVLTLKQIIMMKKEEVFKNVSLIYTNEPYFINAKDIKDVLQLIQDEKRAKITVCNTNADTLTTPYIVSVKDHDYLLTYAEYNENKGLLSAEIRNALSEREQGNCLLMLEAEDAEIKENGGCFLSSDEMITFIEHFLNDWNNIG